MSRTTKSTTVSQSNPDWNTENQAGTRMRITKRVVIVVIVAVKRTPARRPDAGVHTTDQQMQMRVFS